MNGRIAQVLLASPSSCCSSADLQRLAVSLALDARQRTVMVEIPSGTLRDIMPRAHDLAVGIVEVEAVCEEVSSRWRPSRRSPVPRVR